MRAAAITVVALLALASVGSASAQESGISAEVVAGARQVSSGDREGGLRRLEALAAAGDLDAHNLLGELYSGLDGVERDRPKSCAHFRTSREARPSASHNYGQCLWEGVFGTRELGEARIWYRRAADGGFLQAKCALGNMLLRGEGGPVDASAGLALCREAAEGGEPNAQADMGDHSGSAGNFADARRWYELAAAQNQRNAAFQRGVLDWNGLGGPIDLAAASVWLQRAHAAGRDDAAALIGRSALIRAVPNAPQGPIDPVLLAEAKAWFTIAMTGDPDEQVRAESALRLAQISGYEATLRQAAP